MITVASVPPGFSITEIPAPAPPAPDILARIETLWNEEQNRRDRPMTNGRIFSLDGRNGPVFTAWETQYKWWLAQRLDADLFPILNIRALAVSSVTHLVEGLVFGRRAGSTTQYAGLWELPPSGGIDHTCRRPEGVIAADSQILTELKEELHVAPQSLTVPPHAFAVMENDADHVVDIVFELRLSLSAKALVEIFANSTNREYTELRIIGEGDVAHFLDQEKGGLSPTSAALVRYLAAH